MKDINLDTIKTRLVRLLNENNSLNDFHRKINSEILERPVVSSKCAEDKTEAPNDYPKGLLFEISNIISQLETASEFQQQNLHVTYDFIRDGDTVAN